MRSHFVTFGSKCFENATKRLEKQAVNMDFFDELHIFNENSLSQDFVNENSHKFKDRSYGYWIWKPWIIKKVLDEMNDGDLLVYLDAGCQLYREGKPRFLQYVSLAKRFGFLAMQLDTECSEIKYTKRDVLDQFPNIDKYSAQIESGIQFICKNEETVNLINKWLEMSKVYHNFNGDRSKIQEYPEFIDHRHDQSCLSLLLKEFNLLQGIIRDETYWEHEWDFKMNYPIHARRSRS